MNEADSNHWSATASSVPPSSDTAPGVPTAAAQPEAAASARDEVVDALSEHACCFSEKDAKRMVDALVNEVAEQIRKSPEDDREPLIHSGLTDVLPERHPDAHQCVYCDGAECSEMLHCENNENMQTWVEAPKGNYCLPCFNALDRAQGCDGWSGERA